VGAGLLSLGRVSRNNPRAWPFALSWGWAKETAAQKKLAAIARGSKEELLSK
jgi:hypothetical protein